MSRRFAAASVFKNALPTPPADKQLWYHDLPLTAEDPNAVRASSQWIIAATGSVGGLVAVHWEDVGKGVENKRGGEWNALGGKVWGLDVVETEDGQTRVVVGGQGGFKIWSLSSPSAGSFEPTLVLSISTPSSVQTIAFHPTTPSLVLTTTASTVSIWDTTSDSTAPAIELEPFCAKGLWDASWSWDGREVAAVAKDGTIGVWTPRTSTKAVVSSPQHLGLKQSAIVSLGGGLWLTTGFSKTRQRWFLLFDSSKDLAQPVSTTGIDFETAPLWPVVDVPRRIVYLAGKGESTLRSFEVSSASPPVVTPGTAVSLPTAFSALALAPASVLDAMSAEINRLLVVGKTGEIIPIPVKVPRRNYIDFVDELFPLVREIGEAQTAKEWLAGGDAEQRLVSQDPKAKRAPRESKAAVEANAPSVPAPSPSTPSTATPTSSMPSAAPIVTPTSTSSVAGSSAAKEVTPASTPVRIASTPSATQSSASHTAPVAPAPAAGAVSPPSPAPVAAAPSTSTPSASTPAKPTSNGPPAPRWSRNFLSGSSPLLPAYENLSCLSTSHPPDSLLLQATEKYLFFPISGAGGRIAVHPVENKGRLPLQADFPCVANGSEVVDFVVEEGENARLVTAGEDGIVKVWAIPEVLEGALNEPEVVIHAKGVDKVAKLVSNPAARHVLAVLSNDFGEGYVRISNTKTGEVQEPIKIEGGGVYTASWSPTGSHLALACKDRQIRVLDPRSPSTILSGRAHDSPRSFQLTWLDSIHLASVGFSSGSLRKILLHRLASSAIEIISTLALDVSPSVLFPFFDPDTSILFVWGKGERTVSPFDVNLSNSKSPLHRLPQFAGSLIHGWTFLPKTSVDVRKVEVLRALRLTSKTVEEVSFKVPRQKMELFQDDVFPLTRGGPELGWEEWVGGKEGREEGWVSLKPEGMMALSKAPKAAPVVKKKIEFGKKEPTEAEKRAQSMDEMFAKAKMDDDDEEDRIKGDEEWSD